MCVCFIISQLCLAISNMSNYPAKPCYYCPNLQSVVWIQRFMTVSFLIKPSGIPSQEEGTKKVSDSMWWPSFQTPDNVAIMLQTKKGCLNVLDSLRQPQCNRSKFGAHCYRAMLHEVASTSIILLGSLIAMFSAQLGNLTETGFNEVSFISSSDPQHNA